jgi:hypothetical protein
LATKRTTAFKQWILRLSLTGCQTVSRERLARRRRDRAGSLPRASLADAVADLCRGHIETGNEGRGAVANVFKLRALGASGPYRLRRRNALERLQAGHLVDAARLDPGGRKPGAS